MGEGVLRGTLEKTESSRFLYGETRGAAVDETSWATVTRRRRGQRRRARGPCEEREGLGRERDDAEESRGSALELKRERDYDVTCNTVPKRPSMQ